MHKTLQFHKFEDIDFKCDILGEKYRKKAFLVQIYVLLFLHRSLQLDKLEDANFEYGNIIFKFQPKYTQIRRFRLKFNDFFCAKLCNKINLGTLTSTMTIDFQNCCPIHPNKAFLVPKFRIFIFAKNFAIN